MKNLLFAAVMICFFSSCSNEATTNVKPAEAARETQSLLSRGVPCPMGTQPVLEYEFDCLRLHRASRGCRSGFGICSDGHWEIHCKEVAAGSYIASSNRALVCGVISENQTEITLHFPIDIMRSPGFIISDFNKFGFDSDYTMYEGVTISAGEYTPSFTNSEILVTCRLR
jgi:hypothetical protein